MHLDRLRGPVAVLMGGWSGEREISLRSGAAVCRALDKLGVLHHPVDVGRDVARVLMEMRPAVAFIALHGRGGEDGSMQGLLEIIGLPYTGSGVLASALAMNKKESKWLFERHRIPTPAWVMAVPGDAVPAFGLPLVVKPVDEGSTLDVTIVREAEDYAPALARAAGRGGEVLVEAYIPGRELTVSVLGRRALPAVEIFAAQGFYDYAAKYTAGVTRYECPANLTPELETLLAELSLRAAAILGCRGAVRADYRVDPEGRPWLLELNTIPGMTETSLLPKAAAASGLTFEEMVGALLDEALEGERS